MARFKASARRIAVLNRLEREAIDEARIVLFEHKPIRVIRALPGLEPADDFATARYLPAARVAATVLEVYAGRIRHVEQGATL